MTRKLLFFACIPFLMFMGCGGGSSFEPEVPEVPEIPTEPTPEGTTIETTENGSSTFIMLGFVDNITAGGVLNLEGFEKPLYIKDQKICGTSYTFSACSDVNRLDAMPSASDIKEWKESFVITEGALGWGRYITETENFYVKLRIAYIEENKVGIEYKTVKEKRPDINSIKTTEEGSTPLVLISGTSTANSFTPAEGMTTIYVKDKSFVGSGYTFTTYSDIVDLSKLPSIFTVREWSSKAEIKVNAAYWIRCLTPTEYIYIKCRTAYVDNDRIGIEYKIDSKETVANKNINTEINGKSYVFDYSIPHLNSENYYIEHAVTMNGKEILNYALEWNTEKKHSAWVAFSFDEITNGDVTGRTDAWDVDPQLSIEMQTSNEQHKSDGFDRGHICASEDRVYSVTANKQTFYYSNISPQFNSFNGGYWAAFEYRVRRWARYSFDKLYVTKGGSLNNLLINYTGNNKGQDGILPTTDEKGLTIHGVACPKYYYMAILAEKDGNYQALGFWIEHRDDYGYDYNDAVPSDVLQNHVISIDQLEQNTGIDFFCNLPDEIEDDVEAGYTLSDWSW